MNISIIIPVFNTSSKYLSCLLEKLEKLNKENFEILIINDCSTNIRTLEAIKKYEHCKNFRIINNKKNCGVSFSRNIGIKFSHYDYVMFIDSDDLVSNSVLEEIAKLTDLPNLTVFSRTYIGPNTLDVNETTNKLEIFDNTYSLIDILTNREISNKFNNYALSGVRCKIFEKSFLVKNNLFFNEKLFQYEDTLFLAAFSSLNPTFAFYKNYCDYYRINRKSITHSYNKKYNKNFEIFCLTFYDLFQNNQKLLNMLDSSIIKTYLPVRSWISFKTFHWIDGIRFLKLDYLKKMFTNNSCLNQEYSKISYFYRKNSFVFLYFYINFKHIFSLLKKRK